MPEADTTGPARPGKPVRPQLKKLKPGQLLVRAPEKVRPASAVAGTWQPPTPEELGELLPQYRIERLIGRGGMGVVYKGIQPELERPVAIKLLAAEVAADEKFVTRFKREARLLAKLQHSRIITVHDFGQTSDGRLYLVMEYIGGGDLRSLLRGPGLLPDQALLAISQICDALCAAHREGVVHHDIKPENILITQDGYIKLVDFGLARPLRANAHALTSAGIVLGTPAYMAPEQCEGSADHRSDIYALGVMLYEMLTGKRPRGVFDPPSKRAKIDPRLDEVVMKALQQEPDRRYQDASDLKRDVDSIRATPQAVAGVAKRPGGKARLLARDLTRLAQLLRKRAVASGVVLGVTLVALAGVYLWRNSQRKVATELPEQTMPEEHAGDRTPALSSADTMPAPKISAAATAALNDPPSTPNFQPLPVAKSVANETSTPSPKPIQKAEPIVAPPPPVSPVATGKSPPFINSLGMTFVPAGTRGVLFCAWDTRVQDFREFVNATNRDMSGGISVMKVKPNEKGGYSTSWELDTAASWKNPGFPQTDTHPVVGVNVEDARAFCAWLTDKERKARLLPPGVEYRLPTDQEWSAAVGGALYPWGNEWPPPKGAGNFGDQSYLNSLPGKGWTNELGEYEDFYPRTSPVGRFQANVLGIFDMGGNVWQWCDTEYKASMNSLEALEKHPVLKDEKARNGTLYRVVRGGSWHNDNPFDGRSSTRFGAHPATRSDEKGFRCVLAYSSGSELAKAGTQGSATATPTVSRGFAGKDTPILMNSGVLEAPKPTTRLLPLANRPMVANSLELPSAMQGRMSAKARADAMMMHGGNKESEEAVLRGLRWLVKNQTADGSWGSRNKGAMTGLALLSFLGHGETPVSPEFGPAIQKAVDWFMQGGAKFEGRLSMSNEFGQLGFHEQAMATYALSEYYTISKDERVVQLLEKAVGHIVEGQSLDGGWAYGATKTDASDTALTGWQIQALNAAHLTGLNIPGVDAALDKAILHLKRVQGPLGGFGDRSAWDNYAHAGLGVYCTVLWTRKWDKMIRNGIEFIMKETAKECPVEYQGENADLHAWYYNTNACFMAQGAAWQKWNRLFQTEIVKAQSSDGSWPPMKASKLGGEHPGVGITLLSLDPFVGAQGFQTMPDGSGPFYRASLCILMLEVYYRYTSFGR